MPRKKTSAEPEIIRTAPGDLPPGAIEEPFHAGQCDSCQFYSRARYIAGARDLELALAGQRISMGLCMALRKLLVAATAQGCGRFTVTLKQEPRPAERDGSGEWVLR